MVLNPLTRSRRRGFFQSFRKIFQRSPRPSPDLPSEVGKEIELLERTSITCEDPGIVVNLMVNKSYCQAFETNDVHGNHIIKLYADLRNPLGYNYAVQFEQVYVDNEIFLLMNKSIVGYVAVESDSNYFTIKYKKEDGCRFIYKEKPGQDMTGSIQDTTSGCFMMLENGIIVKSNDGATNFSLPTVKQ